MATLSVATNHNLSFTIPVRFQIRFQLVCGELWRLAHWFPIVERIVLIVRIDGQRLQLQRMLEALLGREGGLLVCLAVLF